MILFLWNDCPDDGELEKERSGYFLSRNEMSEKFKKLISDEMYISDYKNKKKPCKNQGLIVFK
jgi:hypothetical protein